MTDREKAIVMAHTGICMLEGEKLGVFYQYLEELYGRPVYTHELVMLDIKEKSKPDFLKMCIEEEIPPMPRSEKHTETHGNACVRLIKLQDAIDTVNSIDNLDAKARGGICINLIGLPSAEPEQRWISCSERLPECEQEVLICTKKKIYISKNSGFEWYEEPIITPALYEDGTMLEVNSKWIWEDIDYAGWDEEEDCGIIPEGWWENRHFNPDEVYNNPVDKEVIAWMPLPECYRGENDG